MDLSVQPRPAQARTRGDDVPAIDAPAIAALAVAV
jgi:hypothetical protein